MMIEKTMTGTTAVLKIIGRMDTTTGHELEAAISGCITEMNEPVLDCEGWSTCLLRVCV